jgi:1-acyl-sn-glycerol-3-phosphate acyltransferase
LTFYDASRPFIGAAVKFVCSCKVNRGFETLPEGPVIVVSNHLSWIDIPLIGLAIPRRIAFMAKSEYFRSPFHAFLVRLFGGFMVDRGTVDRTALSQALEALHDGCALGIFPEGTRSRSLQLQRGKLGTAYIALTNDASIIPIGVSGTEKIRSRYENKASLFHRPEVTINVGQPFKLPSPVNSRPSRAELASGTETIMRRIAELLPEDYRGVYRGN